MTVDEVLRLTGKRAPLPLETLTTLQLPSADADPPQQQACCGLARIRPRETVSQ
ncbi:hypothetical protein [Pelomonas cellulosilytica]|uniref:Uncharacterized protein n=1 Tax=Pelomonas cellulosilytica TaxID=2906762 RepID=A0ABS8XUV3_9BURK|nr:hypothetical protein [Pelomonas sp. P8]MCE4555455.1 hypothetical protein [Pelomonas sp. P8]